MDRYLGSLSTATESIAPRVSFPVSGTQEAKFSGPPGNLPYGSKPTSSTLMANHQYDRVSSGFDDRAPMTNQEMQQHVDNFNKQEAENAKTTVKANPETSSLPSGPGDPARTLLTGTGGKAIAAGATLTAVAAGVAAQKPVVRNDLEDQPTDIKVVNDKKGTSEVTPDRKSVV